MACPAADLLANSLRSGSGKLLRLPDPAALLAALCLFGDAAPAAAAAPSLPTGSAWPLLRIVTADGLQTHSVQPSMAAGVDSRGATWG